MMEGSSSAAPAVLTDAGGSWHVADYPAAGR